MRRVVFLVDMNAFFINREMMRDASVVCRPATLSR
jgi:hypothetical protein